MSLAVTTEQQPLSVLLKNVSTNSHESLDKRIMALAPFSSRERYALFVRTQARLHQVTSHWYQSNAMKTWFSDLHQRDRLSAVLLDCNDLGITKEAQVEDALVASQVKIDNPYGALGWLYTVEGSNLGAAFLLKIARTQLELSETFGARHLAGHDDGRGLHWRRFREELDAIPLTAEQLEQAQQGALQAFLFARESVEQLMGPAPLGQTPLGEAQLGHTPQEHA